MRVLWAVRTWARGVAIALDQLGNALFFGHADETLSSRLAREKKHGDSAGDVGCAILDALDPDHCSSSIEETPEGETDAHHLGRVIYELPRDPATRLHKVTAHVCNWTKDASGRSVCRTVGDAAFAPHEPFDYVVDSPNSVAPQLEEFAARGYERINRGKP